MPAVRCGYSIVVLNSVKVNDKLSVKLCFTEDFSFTSITVPYFGHCCYLPHSSQFVDAFSNTSHKPSVILLWFRFLQ